MKKTKRFAAAVAAMALALSMTTVTAFADPPGSSTIGEVEIGTEVTPAGTTATTTVKANDVGDNHTFKAYPIFTGTIDGSKISNAAVGNVFTLAQIAAAAGVAETADLNTVLAKIETFNSDSKDALAFAKKLAANVGDNTAGGTLLDKDGEALATGYYLILEKNGTDNNVLTANILKVVGGETLTVSAKTDAPTLVKKVGEEKATLDNDYGASGDYKFNDVADHSITEAVPFKLFGTMPSNIAMYDHYMYKITDTYDDGITVDADTIVVKIGNDTVYDAGAATGKTSPAEAAKHGLTVTVDATNRKIVVNFVDIKVYGVAADSKVTVEYEASLNAAAEKAVSNEQNGAKLTYSRDFDSTVEWNPYTGTEEQPKTPSPTTPGYPETPEDSTPENPNGDEETENSNDSPEDKVILYTYELDIQKTDGQTAITGDAAKAAEFTVKQGNKYISVDANNNKVSGFRDTEARINLNENGKLKIIGLDDGTYTITEVTPPTGYRLPEKASFTVNITGGIVTTQEWNTFTPGTTYDLTEQDITIGGDGAVNVKNPNKDEAGLYSAELVNAAIGSLPETGGIGTTLFYVGGGVLAAAAGTILIAKKRSKKEEQ